LAEDDGHNDGCPTCRQPFFTIRVPNHLSKETDSKSASRAKRWVLSNFLQFHFWVSFMRYEYSHF
jgi:hypothetical protein